MLQFLLRENKDFYWIFEILFYYDLFQDLTYIIQGVNIVCHNFSIILVVSNIKYMNLTIYFIRPTCNNCNSASASTPKGVFSYIFKHLNDGQNISIYSIFSAAQTLFCKEGAFNLLPECSKKRLRLHFIQKRRKKNRFQHFQ